MASLAEGRAGMFNCSGPCERKRLVAAEFSSKMVEIWQKDAKAQIMCKTCTMANQEAAASSKNSEAAKKVQAYNLPSEIKCALCGELKDASAYSNNNLRIQVVTAGKSKCKPCILDAEKAEREAAAAKKQANLEDLREKARKAEASGDTLAALKALSAASAAEASISTGVRVRKPPPKRRR